jgi:hypothetical protein
MIFIIVYSIYRRNKINFANNHELDLLLTTTQLEVQMSKTIFTYKELSYSLRCYLCRNLGLVAKLNSVNFDQIL